MPPQSAAYQMADRLHDGRLADRLRDLRAAGLSFAGIARELYADRGIVASGTTVAAWCRQLGIEEPAA